MSIYKKILLVFGIFIVLVAIGNAFKEDEKEPIETEIKSMEEQQSKSEKFQEEDIEEHQESDVSEKEFDNVKDSFTQGFEDNFEISEENQENMDSIKESVEEIWNDEDVQDSYERWKDSLKSLFGNSD